MNASTSGYIHGTTPDEQRRLSALNDMLNSTSLRELGLRGGEHVLDVGSGLGQLARGMARAAGASGRVIGIERSREQIVEAGRLAAAAGESSLVEFREGDALAFPLAEAEWGTFDVAHTRFLLEHVPDPAGVVAQMARAVRPGGRVVLEDDDHDVQRLWPEPPGLRLLWETYMRTYDRLGNDPIIGRRLVALLHGAGLEPVRNTWLFFGGCAGDAHFAPLVSNLAGIYQGARAAMIATGAIDGAQFDDAMGGLEAWGRRPDAAFWFARCWAEGRRPA
jgi:SAM-dependent methyltransferase